MPVDSDKEVTGYTIDIFSPYYPCNAPNGFYDVECTFIPRRYGFCTVKFCPATMVIGEKLHILCTE